MSGINEIESWVASTYDFKTFFDVDQAYTQISLDFEANGRLPLDDILLNEKNSFLNWLDKNIIKPEPVKELDRMIYVHGYSYIRNGKTINVSSYYRQYARN